MKLRTYLLLFVAIFVFAGCKQAPAGKSLIADGAIVEEVASGFVFTEGPAGDAEGDLYFTDVAAQKIYKLGANGKISVFMENTLATNGLYFDTLGKLIGCVGNGGKIAYINPDATMVDIVTSYNNLPFNSPNDLWIDPKGGIYFTDPRYGNRDNLPQGGEHVYYIRPGRKTVVRVIDDMVRPNGIVGTPNGKTLYVTDHGGQMTYKYKINKDGTLTNKKLFVMEGADGMALDESGNLYITTDAVYIYSPDAELLETIKTPQQPSNVTFGGRNKDILYITARTGLYKIKMNVRGV